MKTSISGATFLLSLVVLLNSCVQQPPAAELLSGVPNEEVIEAPWTTDLGPCVTGRKYLFHADFYRDRWGSGVYAFVEAWGERKRLNSHLQYGKYQWLETLFTCPDRPTNDSLFFFGNPYPGYTFRMKNPLLEQAPEVDRDTAPPPFIKDRFAIGFYGMHSVADLEAIRKLAANTVILPGSAKNLEEMITTCHRLGLAYVLSTPHDPDRIAAFVERIAPMVNRDRLAFYVNDEPEIRSAEVPGVVRTRQLLRQRFPTVATCMATVRPMGAFTYRNGADYFMSDQYPVPHIPMIWLSDSMDEIAELVGRHRLASVIQAFGGKAWANGGWPRLPTWQEMDALAMLSILHGSRAVFFYTWDAIGKTEKSRADMGRVIGRLNHIYPWLREQETLPQPKVTMLSTYRCDARGNPAVQCGLRDHEGKRLLLCVNTTGTFVEAQVSVALEDKKQALWRELFTGKTMQAEDGRFHLYFAPYDTKAYRIALPVHSPQ